MPATVTTKVTKAAAAPKATTATPRPKRTPAPLTEEAAEREVDRLLCEVMGAYAAATDPEIGDWSRLTRVAAAVRRYVRRLAAQPPHQDPHERNRWEQYRRDAGHLADCLDAVAALAAGRRRDADWAEDWFWATQELFQIAHFAWEDRPNLAGRRKATAG